MSRSELVGDSCCGGGSGSGSGNGGSGNGDGDDDVGSGDDGGGRGDGCCSDNGRSTVTVLMSGASTTMVVRRQR
jgi:hypothetical protein